ncbi:DNA repair protein RecO [Thalassotalea euphylliae]|uniref:DNA repair protein RecO n=1 Tax=Thalassotalea euphylliae TaxID=1655234 RepID=UPI00363D1DBB
MATEQQNAFVLHTRPYQENKLLVELLTEFDGKIAAVTYATQSKINNKKALLQPFTPLIIEFSGRSNLKKLHQVEAAGKSSMLSGTPLYCGFYMNELLVRLLPEHIPCDSLYQHYVKALISITDNRPLEAILRRFELTLLDELGLALDFTPAFTSQSSHLSFSSEHGFIEPIEGLQQYFRPHLQAIAEQELISADVLATCKLLMRNILNQLLGHRPLNSRKLFEKRE